MAKETKGIRARIASIIEDLVIEYSYLVGYPIDEIEINEDHLRSCLKKLVNKRRQSLKEKLQNNEIKLEDIPKYIKEEDVIRNFPSLINLTNDRREKENRDRITITGVRRMDLLPDNHEGFTEQEKDFIKKRLEAYNKSYTASKPNDEFIIYQTVLTELSLAKLNRLSLEDPADNRDFAEKISKKVTTYLRLCDAMSTLRKQRISKKGLDKDKNPLQYLEEIEKEDLEKRKKELEIEEKEWMRKRGKYGGIS